MKKQILNKNKIFDWVAKAALNEDSEVGRPWQKFVFVKDNRAYATNEHFMHVHALNEKDGLYIPSTGLKVNEPKFLKDWNNLISNKVHMGILLSREKHTIFSEQKSVERLSNNTIVVKLGNVIVDKKAFDNANSLVQSKWYVGKRNQRVYCDLESDGVAILMPIIFR